MGKAYKVAQAKSGPIRVLVAGGHRIDCELITDALKRIRSQFDVIASGGSSAELKRALAEKCIDIVLLDENLEDGPFTGFVVLRELRVTYPESRVIMLLDCSERDLVVDAFRAGARGVFSRNNSFDTLCKCIITVHQGQIWTRTDQLQFVIEALSEAAPLRVVNANGAALLTHREMEVVRLTAEGLSNRDIAGGLNLSEHTVKNYLYRIFDKLGISSRVELVLYALSGPKPPSQHDASEFQRASVVPQLLRRRAD